MRAVIAISAFLTLVGCGSGSEATAAAANVGQKDTYRVKIENHSAPAGFFLKKPDEQEKAQEIAELEGQFQSMLDSDQSVHATYRYLQSGKNVLVEKIAYINAGPRYGNKSGAAYVNYMSVKDGKLISILCMPFEPVASEPVASSNCAREVSATLGPDFLALIRSNPDDQ